MCLYFLSASTSSIVSKAGKYIKHLLLEQSEKYSFSSMTKRDEKLFSCHPKMNKVSQASRFVLLEFLIKFAEEAKISRQIIFMSKLLMKVFNLKHNHSKFFQPQQSSAGFCPPNRLTLQLEEHHWWYRRVGDSESLPY